MNSDLVTKWTAILTNMAVVIGLVFVALEFRSTTRAIQAERVNSNAEFYHNINIAILQDKELAALRYKANTEPGALSDSEILRYTAYLDLHHGNFLNIYRNYRDGLVPEEDWEYAKAAIGWAFFSEPAMDYVEILDASNVESPVHAFIEESVSIARAYCNNPDNKCVKRYDVQRSWKN